MSVEEKKRRREGPPEVGKYTKGVRMTKQDADGRQRKKECEKFHWTQEKGCVGGRSRWQVD